MIKALVGKIVNFIAIESNIDDIYYLDRVRYGLEVIMSEGVKFIVMFLISIILNRVTEFCIITILISGVRTKLGGGHCDSFMKCFVKTISVYLIMYSLSDIVNISAPIRLLILICFIVTVFTARYINKLGEVKDNKKLLKIKISTSFIYLFTYILVRIIDISTYINLVLLFGVYMICEYYMNNGRKIK